MIENNLSVAHLILAERSRRSGPGSMAGKPVAEVVVVQVDEILRSNPGGKLRLKRCKAYVTTTTTKIILKHLNTHIHIYTN